MRRLQVQISIEFFMRLLDVACTVLCLPEDYSQWPVTEWSKLSFSSPDLLAHIKVVGSNPAKGYWSSTFIPSIQIRNYPTPHMYVHCTMYSCPTLEISVVQSKTTSLCSSITVITVLYDCNLSKYFSN